MVVAVVAMGMVQPCLTGLVDNKVAGVIAVRHRLMAAARATNMVCIVPQVAIRRTATFRILFRHADDMLDDGSVGRLVVQVAVMGIIDVTIVADGYVTTVWAMLVRVISMQWTI